MISDLAIDFLIIVPMSIISPVWVWVYLHCNEESDLSASTVC